VLVTSNAPDWRGLGAPIELKLWPKDTGAEYLIKRTGRAQERAEAETLSEALGGLPLAHEQAAAYCERLFVSFADYARRLAATPINLLDAERDAPAEYHDKLTVAKTFALAIDEAAKLHPAAEPLIWYVALLAPESIPLFLFSEAREKFGEPLASNLAGDGLDEAVAALRTFALVDREMIADERDTAVTTDTIRLHRLVRIAAATRPQAGDAQAGQRVLIEAMAWVYPAEAGILHVSSTRCTRHFANGSATPRTAFRVSAPPSRRSPNRAASRLCRNSMTRPCEARTLSLSARASPTCSRRLLATAYAQSWSRTLHASPVISSCRRQASASCKGLGLS
jgi:hypothetical protein